MLCSVNADVVFGENVTSELAAEQSQTRNGTERESNHVSTFTRNIGT